MRARNTKGFTLIELMIVVAIVGIVAAVAYPSYVEFVQKSRRGDAMASLADIRIEQEKWRANNTLYATSAALSAADAFSATSKDGYYSMDITAPDATGFNATAAPAGAQVDDNCGTFAIDENGPVYTGGNADADCWER